MEGNAIRRFIRRIARRRKARRNAILAAIPIIAALALLGLDNFGRHSAVRDSRPIAPVQASAPEPILLKETEPLLRVTDSRRYGSVLGKEYSAPFLEELDWIPAQRRRTHVRHQPLVARWEATEASTLRVVTNARASPEPRPSL